ncbi:MAG: hypothetical protein ACPGO3_00085 [Magnetospiraceae bacterium]
MRLMPRIGTVLSITGMLFLTSCALPMRDSHEVDMHNLDSQLQYVAVAVADLEGDPEVPDDLSGQALLHEATNINPSLLNPFDGYFLDARLADGYSSVLVCDKKRRTALTEDAGCTATRTDAKFWRDSPGTPCEFSLNLTDACKGQ